MRWLFKYYEFEYSSRRYVVRHKVMIASGCEDIVSQLGPDCHLIDIFKYEE